jgi:hypothetical protein
MDTRSVQKVVRSKSAAGALFLLAVVLALFLPWLTQRSILGPMDIVSELFQPWRSTASVLSVHNHFVSDAVTQYIPYRINAAQSLEADGYVGWNPLVFGGSAQAANTMALSSDWSTQLYKHLNFWPAWHIGRMVQFFVAGLGMFVFLRARSYSPAVAVFVAVAYLLNTQFVVWIYHQWALASFCWVPWMLWALYAAKDRSTAYLAAAALFLALSLLGGTLQHAAYVVLVFVCLWVGWVWEARSNARATARSTALLFIAGLLGAGMAAYGLEPTIQAYVENVRSGHERGALGYAAGVLQPLLNAVSLPFYALPSIMGAPQSLDLWKALKSDAFNVASFGTVPVVIAFMGFFSRRVPLPARLLVAAGLLIPLTPLVGPLYHRVQLLWIVGGCWTAAAWLDSLDDGDLARFVRRARLVLTALLIAWTVASLALLMFRAPLESLVFARVQSAAADSQFGMFTDWLRDRAGLLIDQLYIWNPWQMLVIAGVGLSIFGLSRIRGAALWPGLVAALGVFLQLFVFWWQWTTWSPPRDVYGEAEAASVLQKEVGASGRLALNSGAPAQVMFPPNTLAPLGVAIVGGYDSIHPDGMRSPTGKSWDFPGATHFLGGVDEEKPEGWQEVWRDRQWMLLRNPTPKVGMVTLESGLPVPLRPADFKRGSMNTMEAVVPAGAVTLELFSNWHRGWKWRDDPGGQWIETSAGPIKGVGVGFDQPTTETKVVYFQFDPSPPNWVWVVSGLSAVLILALALSGGKDDEAAR